MERQLAVCQCHRPPVMVKVPALRDVLDVWWVCLTAAWEGRHLRSSAGHHAPLSTLLLSAVHPVALYTSSQPPSHCKQGCAQRVQTADWHNPSLILSVAT
jgi:hypothetical protein